MNTDLPKVLDADTAARHLGIAASTLAKMRLAGSGPVFCKLGRRVLYRQEDLNTWLDLCRRQSTSDRGADQA